MKNNNAPASAIHVHQLKVGMHVHLDVGWMDHPFARSSFKIASAAQIEAIRGMGLEQVRWDPLRSEPGVVPEPLPAPAPAAHPVAVVIDQEAAAREARRDLMAAQQASLARCEREFAQAGRVHRQVFEQVQAQPEQAGRASVQLIDGFLGHVTDSRDTCLRLLGETSGERSSSHPVNVAVIAMLLGKAIGLSGEELHELGVGAMLHDIGKVALPERVRCRDDRHSHADVQFYQEHVAHGIDLARKMKLSLGAALVIAQHHEHVDGTGFPQRLTGDRISKAARIVALANCFDNLCNPHNPIKALTPHEALSLMFAQMKARFDAVMLGAFIKMMGVYPPGSVVQLTDDRYAMVVSVNAARPLKPRVIVHEPGVPREEALIVDLEDQAGLGIRRSLKPAQLPKDSLDYLSPRERVCYFFEGGSPVRDEATEGMAA
ncbi:HD-GYP domain-containing protein [Caldimonas brevitalea]|uniref:Phosphohydrolase n=1 Tax=Caldimonas brevitalea TaxID=413882 RepID=A0A0G3BHX8_9BURK|nr:HD-GYP domain-containing protein [Caldimonas brevitalea]AKJ28957.1 phosphohydrolase [Caldimonas brevitalea]